MLKFASKRVFVRRNDASGAASASSSASAAPAPAMQLQQGQQPPPPRQEQQRERRSSRGNSDHSDDEDDSFEFVARDFYSALPNAPAAPRSSAVHARLAADRPLSAAPAMPPPAMDALAFLGDLRAPDRVQADTNVLAIEFGQLGAESEMWAGDVTFCPGCRAAVSRSSRAHLVLKQSPRAEEGEAVVIDAAAAAAAAAAAENDTYTWTCEFCSRASEHVLLPEDIPSADVESREYVLSVPESSNAASPDGADAAGAVVFVIDTSGSMCVTTEVRGHLQLRGGARRDEDFHLPPEAGMVNAPVQRPSAATTWVSRLQCVQAAVSSQIEEWQRTQPARRVQLVTFSRDVVVVGDGSGAAPPEVVAGDKLSRADALRTIGARHACSAAGAVGADGNGARLIEQLYALEESGPTALGPAMLLATSMAGARGRVVVCTDGLANVGLGALDVPAGAAREAAAQWYTELGREAVAAGITVDIISIEGDACALEELGRVAELTGGAVTRVNPLELTRNFASILSEPVVATHVRTRLLLHRAMRFRHEAEEGAHVLERELGNVTASTEITFEYEVVPDAVPAGVAALPFQLQVEFTRPNGMRCLRVISCEQALTSNRREAEEGAAVELLAANAAQQTARLAQRGEVLEARANAAVWSRYMERHAKSAAPRGKKITAAVINDLRELGDGLVQQQQQMSSASPSYYVNHSSAAPAPAGLAPAAPPAASSSSWLGGVLSRFTRASSSAAPAAAGSAAAAAPAAPAAENDAVDLFAESAAAPSMAAEELQSRARLARTDAQYAQISANKSKSSRSYRSVDE